MMKIFLFVLVFLGLFNFGYAQEDPSIEEQFEGIAELVRLVFLGFATVLAGVFLYSEVKKRAEQTALDKWYKDEKGPF